MKKLVLIIFSICFIIQISWAEDLSGKIVDGTYIHSYLKWTFKIPEGYILTSKELREKLQKTVEKKVNTPLIQNGSYELLSIKTESSDSFPMLVSGLTNRKVMPSIITERDFVKVSSNLAKKAVPANALMEYEVVSTRIGSKIFTRFHFYNKNTQIHQEGIVDLDNQFIFYISRESEH